MGAKWYHIRLSNGAEITTNATPGGKVWPVDAAIVEGPLDSPPKVHDPVASQRKAKPKVGRRTLPCLYLGDKLTGPRQLPCQCVYECDHEDPAKRAVHPEIKQAWCLSRCPDYEPQGGFPNGG